MGSGGAAGKCCFTLCGPKGSLCCFVLSLWGVIMLVRMCVAVLAFIGTEFKAMYKQTALIAPALAQWIRIAWELSIPNGSFNYSEISVIRARTRPAFYLMHIKITMWGQLCEVYYYKSSEIFVSTLITIYYRCTVPSTLELYPWFTVFSFEHEMC